MVEQESLGQKLGITQGRLILIGVLGAVLIAVLLIPSDSDEPVGKLTPRKPAVVTKTPKTDSAKRAGQSHRVGNSGSANRKRVTARNTEQWPKADLETMASQDPFAIPLALRPPVALPPAPVEQANQDQQAQEQALENLLSKGVDLVLVTEQGKIAVVEGKQYRIGDVIAGFRITEISPQGIVVEPEGP